MRLLKGQAELRAGLVLQARANEALAREIGERDCLLCAKPVTARQQAAEAARSQFDRSYTGITGCADDGAEIDLVIGHQVHHVLRRHDMQEGRKCRMRCVVGMFTREVLATRVAHRLASLDVINVLADLVIARGAATAIKGWIDGVGAKPGFIDPGSRWENGYAESLNGRLRDELLDGDGFTTRSEAQVLVDERRRHLKVHEPRSANRRSGDIVGLSSNAVRGPINRWQPKVSALSSVQGLALCAQQTPSPAHRDSGV